MKKFKLFIGNEWVDAKNGETFISYNPATGEPVAELAKGSKEDVDKAVTAAKCAFDSGVWSQMDPEERGEYLRKAADIMSLRAEELARYETMDTGKPIRESRDIDIWYSIRAMNYFSKIMTTFKGEVINIPGNFAFDYVTYEPVGVVGTISPWNFPLHLFTRAVCPALAAGNTVVAKASSLTPVTSQLMGEIFLEAGFPAGVVNIVSGPGSVVGEAIMANRDVSMVSFTGSEEVGRCLLEQSSRSPIIKKVILELGGKGPIIAHKDCNLSGAVNSTIQGFVLNQGEVCCASTRLIVHEDIYDEFMGLMVKRLSSLKIGETMDPDTQLGSLIDAHQLETVDKYVQDAIAAGAKALYGAKPYTEGICAKGSYYMPTVLVDVSPDMACVREEIFGPVLVVLKYREIDEAVALANDTTFGLGAAVWSEDPRLLFNVSKRLDAGTVWQNCNIMSKLEAPYGGNKNSGIGRENGTHGILEYMKTKNNILFVGEEYDNFYGFEG
jgi:acyl-CoA reductase-like NAD-dependent aldehyde dehydrogenase